MIETLTEREMIYIYVFFVATVASLIFWCIPKIIAWLLYDTDIMATCCGIEIEGGGRGAYPIIKTYLEYSYNDKGYTTTLFMLFSQYDKKQKIKIRSDKPWKAVSFYEFILGILGVIFMIPIVIGLLFFFIL